jgi:hypothetical protein
MSILSFGRHSPAQTVDANRQPWWDWNPARREPVTASVAAPAAVREPWYSWNPYRRTPRQVEAQGRREGYAKGARDEQRVMLRRQRRRNHPIFALVVLVAAVSGVGFMGLAYEAGSFAAGGAVVDQKLAEWRGDLTGAADRAVDQSGHEVQRVGQSISSQSQQLTQKGG